MDDRRFDSLVKALAAGKSRRSVLKGLLGLGAAATVGSTLMEPDSEAARRPTPTPTPIRCPGNQTPVNGVCTCPGTAPNKCGPDCCTGKVTDPYPRVPGHSECCDNACCFGTCYGEELCCPTNDRPGGLPPTHIVCDGPNGPVCVEGTCCNDSDCDDPFCEVCNLRTHTCGPRCNPQTEVCCTEQAGPGVCHLGTCCPGAPCPGEGQLCCVDEGVATCVTTGECCTVDTDCDNGCLSCVDGACIPQCTRQECCTVASDRADWFCVEEGQCCTTSDCSPATPPGCEVECDTEAHLCRSLICLEGQVCCRDDAGYGNCIDGRICPCVDNDDCPDCQVCAQGTCVPGSGGESCVVIADDDDEDTGYCCDGQCLPADQVCNGGTCCPGGFCDGNGDCCPAGNVGCNGGTCCDGFCDGDGDCCPLPNVGCNGGVCCDVACDQQGNCPSTPPACEPNCFCGDGVVDPATDGLDCNGGIAAGGGVCACGWCVVPLEGCPCGCAGDTECVECASEGVCVPVNQGGTCNGGAGICDDVWCVPPPPPTCEPNCDCSIEANAGLACNGGGGAVCGCGSCIIPMGECLCGCEGDTECVQCDGGDCVAFNDGGTCNGTAVCFGIYCDFCHGIGGGCTVDSHCCPVSYCVTGVCQSCKPNNTPCTSASECCNGGCSGVCFTQ